MKAINKHYKQPHAPIVAIIIFVANTGFAAVARATES
jgi:hypothetical protein